MDINHPTIVRLGVYQIVVALSCIGLLFIISILQETYVFAQNPWDLFWVCIWFTLIILSCITFFLASADFNIQNVLLAILRSLIVWVCWFLLAITLWANKFGT